MSLSVTPQLVYYCEQLGKGEGGNHQFMGKSASEIAATLVAEQIERLIAEGTLDKMPPDRIRQIEEQAREQESTMRIKRRLGNKSTDKLER